jgi:hypothetical protein
MRRIATNAACDHLRVMRPRASWITAADGIEGPKSADRVSGRIHRACVSQIAPEATARCHPRAH